MRARRSSNRDFWWKCAALVALLVLLWVQILSWFYDRLLECDWFYTVAFFLISFLSQYVACLVVFEVAMLVDRWNASVDSFFTDWIFPNGGDRRTMKT